MISEPVRDQSRGLLLKLNFRRKTARVHREFFNPARPLASQQANLQRLGNGNWFVGWGGVPLISEHGPDGGLLFDAELRGISSFYRAYRGAWRGAPRTKPALVTSSGSGGNRAWVSWNGDTRVREWRFLTGIRRKGLEVAGNRKRAGFETRFAIPASARFVRAAGVDARGRLVGRSAIVAIR